MRMKVMISIAWLAMLAACAPPSANSDQGTNAYSDAGALDLSGHYRIHALGSARLSHPIEVSFDEDSVWWEPACAGQGLEYRQVSESAVEFFDPRDPDTPELVCDIGFSPELTEMWEKLAGVRGAVVRPDRSLAINVDGEQWLFEPTTDPMPVSLSGRWRVEMVDGLSTQEMRETTFFSANNSEIWWDPRCAGKVMSYSMTGESFAITEKSYTPPPPPAAGEEPIYPPRAICAIGLPTYLPDAIRALEAATQVKRDHHNRLIFSGEQHTLSLSRIQDESELSPE